MSHDDQPHVPGPSLWPVGLAIGAVVLLVGFVVSWSIVAIGAIIAVLFAFLWLRDVARESRLAEKPAKVAPEKRPKPGSLPRLSSQTPIGPVKSSDGFAP